MQKRALQYRQFIRRLFTMDVCIPFSGSPGETVMFFQQGNGYTPSPNGPSCPFIAREPNELVPEREITDTLNLLEVDHDTFWRIEDHDQPVQALDASQRVSASPAPPSAVPPGESPEQLSKPKDPK